MINDHTKDMKELHRQHGSAKIRLHPIEKKNKEARYCSIKSITVAKFKCFSHQSWAFLYSFDRQRDLSWTCDPHCLKSPAKFKLTKFVFWFYSEGDEVCESALIHYRCSMIMLSANTLVLSGPVKRIRDESRFCFSGGAFSFLSLTANLSFVSYTFGFLCTVIWMNTGVSLVCRCSYGDY